MDERTIRRERVQNLWESVARKHPPLASAFALDAAPDIRFEQIGGLAAPKEEILTLACAATSPEVYEHWGTHPPTGLLLIGPRASGKGLLARALATSTDTAFLCVSVPRLVIEVVHAGGQVGELLQAWTQALEEIPPLTVFFDELEFSQTAEIGARRPDLPIGPVLDFLVDMVDRAIAAPDHLVVGSTSHPDTLRPAFLSPRRFERVIEVIPKFPDDIVETLQMHAAAAEKRAGRTLFEPVEWRDVVKPFPGPTVGEWIRILHAVLRRKARCEAAGEETGAVVTQDLIDEAERFRSTSTHLPPPGGAYI